MVAVGARGVMIPLGSSVGSSKIGSSVGSSIGSSISVSSTNGVVIAGSVPRYTYGKRVALGVTGTAAGELSERPISKTRRIPMTEHPLIKIGIRRLRSKAGWLSIRDGNRIDSAYRSSNDSKSGIIGQEDTTIMHNPEDCYVCLIPKPTSVFESEGNFSLSRDTIIYTQKDNS